MWLFTIADATAECVHKKQLFQKVSFRRGGQINMWSKITGKSLFVWKVAGLQPL